MRRQGNAASGGRRRPPAGRAGPGREVSPGLRRDGLRPQPQVPRQRRRFHDSGAAIDPIDAIAHAGSDLDAAHALNDARDARSAPWGALRLDTP